MSRTWTLLAFILVLVSLAPITANADMVDPPLVHMIMVEELEYGFDFDAHPVSLDSTSWIGGDWNRVWLKVEGEANREGAEGELQLLYSRLILPFWELQMGLRGDMSLITDDARTGRGHLVFGLEGLAPYWFEVEPAVFVSQKGDVSACFRATYDLYITQRIVAHESIEANAAVQSVPEFGIGSGFGNINLGLRLGYQVRREFMPYMGITWDRAFGETGRLRRAESGSAGALDVVVGVRFWF